MFKGIPKKNNKGGITVAKVRNALLWKNKQTYIVATPKACIKISNIIVDTIFNSNAKVNIITKFSIDIARLTV